ncbi:hypothetical protein KR054_002317 [Drosophila jambulina]|nr:hypothetical protein KR054_002317 [Drosophila jambulina]
MKYRMLNKRKLAAASPSPVKIQDSIKEENATIDTTAHSALELEAASALLLLRYQYDRQICNSIISYTHSTTRSPTPPPVIADNTTPKDQTVRPPVAATQPLKKRSIPPHLLRRSLTPAKSSPSSVTSNNSLVKAKARTPAPGSNQNRGCNKSLLKSCRNMIREFLDNQELI